MLVGRDRGRLESVAAALDGPARHLVADLTQEADLASVEALVADRTTGVDLLVNNAAAGWHGAFAQLDPRWIAQTVALNVTAALRLARAALPPMSARGRGGLINVSSVAAAYPAPDMAVYAASKAFVSSWSAALATELRGSGVTVTCVSPGWVRTDFHDRSGEHVDHVPDEEWLSPDDVARLALAAHLRGEHAVTVTPPVPVWSRAQRSGRAALARSAAVIRSAAAARRSGRTPP